MATRLPGEFTMERYFAEHEFSEDIIPLCCSDVEALSPTLPETMAGARLPSPSKLERYFTTHQNLKDVISLCASDMEPVTVDEVLAMADEDSRRLFTTLKLGYTESQGHPDILRLAAKIHDVTPGDTLEVIPQEGIYIAMHCLVDYLKSEHGDDQLHVVATSPAYQSLHESLETSNCQLDHWVVRYGDNGWHFNLDDLEACLQPNTRLLVVNFPHNPTGFIPSQEEWTKLISICRDRNIFLFSDEMYRLTNNDGAEPLRSACAELDNAIALFGVSKTFALAGLRIGWMCTRNNTLLKKMNGFKDYISMCSSSPSEILAIIALKNKEPIVKRTMNIIQTNLPILDEFFKAHTDIFEWHKPRACSTGFVKVKGWLLENSGGSASSLAAKLRTDAKVLMLPAAMYSFKDEFLRIGFGRVNMKEGIERLERYIQQNKPAN